MAQNFSRPVKPVSKHANLSKDSHWLCAATPDHHCKQTARNISIFVVFTLRKSSRFKPTASPRFPTSPSSSFCTGTRGTQPKRWNSDAHSSRSGRHDSADAKSSHKVTQDPPPQVAEKRRQSRL